MKTSIKIVAYAGVLGAAFAGAFGVGNLTGSPIERSEHGDAHETPSAPAHDAGPHAPGGLQVSDAGYTLSEIAAPESAGEPGALSFNVLGPDGASVTDFTESHEKDLHLIVVRNDTTGFRHVHPTLAEDGTWSIDWEWAAAGTYKVYADFEPTALGKGLTLARTVDVGGEHRPEPIPGDSAVAEVDGYTVTLTGELAAGSSADITATIEQDGQPVTDLQPYLGAYGHLVALRAGDLAYLHVHPDGEPGDGTTEPGPEVRFVVETPTAGTYRLFLDFQVDGQVHTADFTLTTAGSRSEHDAPGAGEAEEVEPGDDPGDDHGDADTDDDHDH